ncbi:hypothetical protein SNEBB_005795 [Seison nebaliae]|nr:hypothetical protein SNEBB_005795 [Seison nebaliae]
MRKLTEWLKNRLVVLDFSAAWCAPCKMLEPVYNDLSQKYANCVFTRADIEGNEDLAEEMSIKSLPTVVFYRDGKELNRIIGLQIEKLKMTLAQEATGVPKKK